MVIVIFKERSTNNIWSVIVFWLSKSHMVSFVGLLRGPSQLNTMNEMRASTQATRPRSHPRVYHYIIFNLRTKNECGPSHFHVKFTFTSRATVSPCLCTFFFFINLVSTLNFICRHWQTNHNWCWFFLLFLKKYNIELYQ
jgi:hypothetical protein